jgi:type IV pilus assembly protein PilB
MAEHRPLGMILLESGRITEADVERTLQHQREHGGYFGQALVTLGVLSRGELDWALASHFDLPFIFPQAEAVDPAAAALVSGDWALANMAVPIVRAGRTVTTVVASPLRPEVIDALRASSGLDINMALAAADSVRDLIHSVYGSAEVRPSADARSCAEFLTEALSSGASAFGISRRGDHALAWWQVGGETQRAPLLPGWEEQLATAISPSPTERAAAAGEGGSAAWDCMLRARSRSVELRATALVAAAGAEYRFEPLRTSGPPRITLPARLASELRLLIGSGAARIVLTATDPERARALLPHLPGAVLGEEVRAVHLVAGGRAHGGEFALPAPEEAAGYDALAAWEFDAVTADLPLDAPGIERLAGLAQFVLLMVDRLEAETVAALGFGWLLHMPGDPESSGWTLRPLNR